MNLNNYTQASKNTSYRNSLKKKYAELIKPFLKHLKPVERPVKLIYTIYRHNNTKFDVGNVGAIVDKFTCDVLVDLGILQDDNYDFVKSVEYKWGGVDKIAPRADVEIIEI